MNISPSKDPSAGQHDRHSSTSSISSSPPEWTSSLILSSLSSPSLTTLSQLSSLSSTSQLRDYDDLFRSLPFYRSCVLLLYEGWREYDLHHLGGESEQQKFEYEYGNASNSTSGEMERHSRSDSGMDDEEEESGDAVQVALGSSLAQDRSWRRLSFIYTFLSHLLSYPEFNLALAQQRGAFDSRFCSRLLSRFEPKFAKRFVPAPHQPLRSPAALQALTGVGGVQQSAATRAMMMTAAPSSSSSSPGGSASTASTAASLSHVPMSILSVVGISGGGPMRSKDPDSPSSNEYPLLRGLLHTVYTRFLPLRSTLRTLISHHFQRFLRSPTCAAGVPELLAVYAAIVRGYTSPVRKEEHTEFMVRNVLPLHTPNTMANELMPILQTYHEVLVYCVSEFLQRVTGGGVGGAATANTTTATSASASSSSSSLSSSSPTPSSSSSSPFSDKIVESVILRLLHSWPPSQMANSPKEVLLLHELEKLLEYCSPAVFDRLISQHLFTYITESVSSSNHRVSERALQLWQNDYFLSLTAHARHVLLPLLFPTLLGEKHWNKSVNKMRMTVVQIFIEQDLQLFMEVAKRYYGVQSKEEALKKAKQQMDNIRPNENEAKESEEEKLLKTQVHVPATLESIKYSDFVFGHVLGAGSFSSVRYAKRIVKGSLPSTWPEYGCKIISRALVKAQKYEENIQREIDLMSTLTHPNITRLIGSCENDQNIYLVMEYAKKGDLHNHISKMGSLDVESARFVAAEMLRALEYLHTEKRVVYGDCKPENVLVHQSGHIKLADFGSARFMHAITATDRVEGTADYLAPEIVKQTAPVSAASDLWAYACVVYQMLAGRTPIWAEEAEKIETSSVNRENEETQKAKMRAKMVKFESREEKFPPSFDPAAKDLIEALLQSKPTSRLGVDPLDSNRVDYSLIKAHPFFSSLSSSNAWSTLHTLPAPQLAGGAVAAAPDAKWARRKNSIMWAPMPKQYVFNRESGFVLGVIGEEKEEEVRETQREVEEERKKIAGGGDRSGSGSGIVGSGAAAHIKARFTGFKPTMMMMKRGEEKDEDGDVTLAEAEEEGEEDDEGLFLSAKDLARANGEEEDEELNEEESESVAGPMRQFTPAFTGGGGGGGGAMGMLPPRHSSRAETSGGNSGSKNTTGPSTLGLASSSSSSSLPAGLPPRPRLAVKAAPSSSSSPLHIPTVSSPVSNLPTSSATGEIGSSVSAAHGGVKPFHPSSRQFSSNSTANSLLAKMMGNKQQQH